MAHGRGRAKMNTKNETTQVSKPSRIQDSAKNSMGREAMARMGRGIVGGRQRRSQCGVAACVMVLQGFSKLLCTA